MLVQVPISMPGFNGTMQVQRLLQNLAGPGTLFIPKPSPAKLKPCREKTTSKNRNQAYISEP